MRALIARLLPLASPFHGHHAGVEARRLGRPPSPGRVSKAGDVMTTLRRTSRNRIARIGFFACALAVLAAAALPQRTSAQQPSATFAISKTLCTSPPGTPNPGCGASIVSLGQIVYYVITVTGLPTASLQNVTLTENFPSGFTPAANGITCTDQTGAPVSPTPTGAAPIGTIALPTAYTITCVVQGSFNYNGTTFTTPGWQPNTVQASSDSGYQTSASWSTFVTPSIPLNTDLSVSKTESPTSITLTGGNSTTPASATVAYTITVANTGTNPQTVTVPNFVLHDTLATLSGSVPLRAQLMSANCSVTNSGSAATSNLVPSVPGSPVTIPPAGGAPVDFFDFPIASPGTIGAGAVITCTVTVKISSIVNCIIAPKSDGLVNQAFFTLSNLTNNTNGTQTGTTYNDINLANDTSTITLPVTTGATQALPNCGTGQLGMIKTQSPANPIQWGQKVSYQITITNNSVPTQAITIPPSGLQDIVTQGYGTQPFTGTFWGAVCASSTPALCTGFTGNLTTGAVWSSAAYGAQSPPWTNTSTLTLQPGQSVTITLTFSYAPLSTCSTVPNVSPKPLTNTALLSYVAPPIAGPPPPQQTFTQSSSVETDIQQQPNSACPLVVAKTMGGGPTVQFGQPLAYTVTFTNGGASATTVGTLMDAVRITDPAYGTPVPFTWTAGTCTWSGVSGTPPPPLAFKGGSGQAIYTSSPALGTRIFTFTNVSFPPNATLTCTFTVTVQQPSLNNPNCSAAPAYFENLGLMDVTNPYNPNWQWPPPPSGNYISPSGQSTSNPPSPANWATVASQLPQCYDVILNKTASIPWTSPTGPAVNYTITATNTGTGNVALPWSTPMGVPNGLVITDTFAAPYNSNIVTVGTPSVCVPNSWCDPIVPPGNSSSPSQAGIKNLAPRASGNWNLTLLPQKNPFPLGVINNCAIVTPSAPFVGQGTFTGPGWYANYANPAPSPQEACVCPPGNRQTACYSVPVLATATLEVIKVIKNGTQNPVYIPPTGFSGGVTCTSYPLLQTQSGNVPWTQTVGGNLAASQSVTSPASPLATILNVPVDPKGFESCLVTENTPGQISVSPRVCPGGFAQWDPSIAPRPIFITTPNTMYTVTVTNTLRCTPTATLQVMKKIDNETGVKINISSPLTFTANVNCTPTATTPVKLPLKIAAQPWANTTVLSSPWSTQVTVPVVPGETCNVTEAMPLPTLSGATPCSGPAVGIPPVWTTTITPVQPMTITAAGTNYQVTITNTLRCQARLLVWKVVSPDPAGVASTTNFPITATCTDLSGNVTTYPPLNLKGNTGSYLPNFVTVGSTCTFTETLPPPFTFQGQTCTWQPAAFSPTSVTIGMTRNFENVTNSYVCAGQTGSLTLVKTADYDSTVLASNPVTVQIQLTCTSLTGAVTKQTVPIVVNNNGSFSQTVSGIPVGSTCTIVELPSALSCWAASYPLGQTVTIQPGTQTLQVVNEEACSFNPTATQVGIQAFKIPIIDGLVNYSPGVTFVFDVNCTGPAGYVYNFSWRPQTTATFTYGFTMPTGSTCAWIELTPPLPPGANPACYWQTSYFYNGQLLTPPGTYNDPLPVGTQGPTAQIVLPSSQGGTTNPLNIQNQLICPSAAPARPAALIKPPSCPEGTQLQGNVCVAVSKTCPPPMIPGPAPGSCVCPEGTQLQGQNCVRPIACTPPQVANAAGTACVCPEGTVLRGRECVRPLECKPPQTANPAGTACVCPEGTVLRGRECVRPLECKPPQTANPAGTACVCPQGTVLRGRECVRPLECKPPQIANPAGTACVCRQGSVPRGGECIECRPPQVVNRAGTACECPQGTMQQGRECVPIGFPRRGGPQPGGGMRR